MFGYILADLDALTPEQKERYRACYCGLCRTLKERHGELSRLTLNYDMTFLVLLLSSMYEPGERSSCGRCVIHPVKKRSWWRSKYSDYAADMNVALAYYNCLDDWQDEHKFLSYAEAKALQRGWNKAKTAWPRQCEAMESSLAELFAIEKERSAGPDAAANCFGRLMGELFVREEDHWAESFRRFGQALGRFIYMMDACVDLEKDKKRGGYNPLLLMERGDMNEQEKLAMLKMLIGECVIEFEKLPLLQDVDIMRNILYSGVWVQYRLARKKRGDMEDDQ